MAKKTTTKKSNPLADDVQEAPVVEESTDVEESAPVEKVAKVAKSVEKTADQEFLSDIKLTERTLAKEEKVHFMIPLAEGEKAGAVHEVFINGYKYPVPKGKMVIIPVSIVNKLSEHYKVGLEAGLEFRIDQDDKKLDALA